MINLFFSNQKSKTLKLLMFLLVCMMSFLHTSWDNAKAQETLYKTILPQKVSGIKKLEFIINDVPKGSTAGTSSLELARDTSIQFLLKFEASGYSKLLVKDVLIKTTVANEEPLKLNDYK